MRAWCEDMTKFCRLQSLLWQTDFCSITFWANRFGTCDICSTRYFGGSCSVTVWIVNHLLLYTKIWQEQTVPCQSKWLMTEGVKTFMTLSQGNCRPFSDARTSLFCFRVILFRKNNRFSLWNFVMWCFFALQVSFENIYYAFAEKLDERTWTRLKEKAFPSVEKMIEAIGE